MTNAVNLKTKYSGTKWFGDIPNNWEVVKIKYLFGESKEKVLAEGYDILSLTLNGIKVRDVSTNEGQLPASFDNYKLVKKGYIVFNPMDLRRGFVDSSRREGIISPAYIVLGCKEKVDTNFYKYFFQWHYNDQIFYHMGRGVSEDHRWTLEEKVLFNYKIVLPPLHTQKAIASYLDIKIKQIDKFIEDKIKLIALLDEQKKTIINEAVTKGVDTSVKKKASKLEWFGDIPEDWRIAKIKQIVSTKITDGPHETPIFFVEGVPFASAESVFDGKINFQYVRGYISKEQDIIYSEKCKPKKNDIFIVKSGSTTGKVALIDYDVDFNIWSPLALVRVNNDLINYKFAFYFFTSDSFQKQVQIFWSFGTQPNIGMGVIENLTITLPSLSVQKEIVSYIEKKISKIDQAISTVRKEIELIEEYKRSLIYQAVTGKIETLLK